MTAKSPSQEIIDDQNKEVVCFDKRGRRIILKKPAYSKKVKMLKLCGAGVGREVENILYLMTFAPIPYVYSIDDYIVPAIDNQLQLDGLFDILDEDGCAAVNEAYSENFGNLKSEAEIKEDIKKLQQNPQ